MFKTIVDRAVTAYLHVFPKDTGIDDSLPELFGRVRSESSDSFKVAEDQKATLQKAAENVIKSEVTSSGATTARGISSLITSSITVCQPAAIDANVPGELWITGSDTSIALEKMPESTASVANDAKVLDEAAYACVADRAVKFFVLQ
jgi:hypothetical protein